MDYINEYIQVNSEFNTLIKNIGFKKNDIGRELKEPNLTTEVINYIYYNYTSTKRDENLMTLMELNRRNNEIYPKVLEQIFKK